MGGTNSVRCFILLFILLNIISGCSPAPTKTKTQDVLIDKKSDMVADEVLQKTFIEAIMAAQHMFGQAAIDFKSKNDYWPGDKSTLLQHAISLFPEISATNIELTGIAEISDDSYEIRSVSKPDKKSPKKFPIKLALTVNLNPPSMVLTPRNLDGFETSSDHSLNSSDKLFGLMLSLEFKSKYGDKIKIGDTAPSYPSDTQ